MTNELADRRKFYLTPVLVFNIYNYFLYIYIMKNLSRKKNKLKKRTSRNKRKVMKGGIVYDFANRTAILSEPEKLKIAEIKGKNRDAAWKKIDEFVKYLKTTGFDINEIKQNNDKTTAYEILLGLLSDTTHGA